MTRKVSILGKVSSREEVRIPDSLKTAFEKWLDNGKRHKSFGRFGSLDRPSSAKDIGLHHVHIITDAQFDSYQKSRTTLYNRTSDTFLIYAIHPEDPAHYLLVAIFDPPAHNTANINSLMLSLIDESKKHFGINW